MKLILFNPFKKKCHLNCILKCNSHIAENKLLSHYEDHYVSGVKRKGRVDLNIIFNIKVEDVGRCRILEC
jgi:hypothetical protein